ncbi:MAG: VWA domain-containing protein [Desulfobacteraceae bacterium]|nr:MAG: VWA domain-containing protein [Desulfobacteraceae bacterium]
MSKSLTAPVLEPRGEGRVALKSVAVAAVIENLLSKVSITQGYENLEGINIEATYTFSIPVEAVLLSLSVRTNGRELKGVVTERKQAEDRYEEAITEGDTAIMLEQVEPGLYTMNVGNIMPMDKIEVSFTYAKLLHWQGDTLRFHLPTTIAPRYGDTLDMAPHQVPEYDLTVENFLSLSIRVLGELAKGRVSSPTHLLDVTREEHCLNLRLAKGKIPMDRDFVLNISAEKSDKGFGVFDHDAGGYAALASFFPRFPDTSEKISRTITIVQDCSGSMGGDSIAQSRKALLDILDLMTQEEDFNLILFGSTYIKIFLKPMRASPTNLKIARAAVKNLDADMGGTEIGSAMEAALADIEKTGRRGDILLITDGEVWNWERVVEEAKASGTRIFTVGVGASSAEAFLETIAQESGGACEIVTPREDMSDKIVRHFKRIYLPRAENISVKWSTVPQKNIPASIQSLYDGDTLHVFAQFTEKPEGEAELRFTLENGQEVVQRLELHQTGISEDDALPTTIARLAAARMIEEMKNPEDISSLAVKYQLMSRETNYLVVDVKAQGDKAVDLPTLRKTPLMAAAGWGGMGKIVCDSMVAGPPPPVFMSRMSMELDEPSGDYFDNETKLSIAKWPSTDWAGLMSELNLRVEGVLSIEAMPSTIREFCLIGMSESLAERLSEILGPEIDERTLVITILKILAEEERFKRAMNRNLKRMIRKESKQIPTVPESIFSRIRFEMMQETS